MNGFSDKVSFIWSVADLLRGPYKPAQYGKVILPLTVLRRLDCVLEPTKAEVLARYESLKGGAVKNQEPILNHVAGQAFHNSSRLDFPKLTDDPDNIAPNLQQYIASFSSRAREIIEYFGFEAEIERLEKADRLYLVVKKFAEIDLHPDVVSNVEMGYIFEELVRKFSEAANETAGDHFTPREVIRLMVNLLFEPDSEALTKPGIVRTLCDPACGTGGMLSVAEDYLRELNSQARLECYGQEYNPESYADLRLRPDDQGPEPRERRLRRQFHSRRPRRRTLRLPARQPALRRGVETPGTLHPRRGRDLGLRRPLRRRSAAYQRRLVPLPAAHDRQDEAPEGSRLAIVFNGSPLFTGDAGSGESNIRRWIIENDWLEAIVALPDQLFYNTGISTYFWIVTNRKRPERRGKVQLIDATGFSQKMRKSLGNKRNEISDEQIAEITRIHGEFAEGEHCKIFANEAFGYRKITVERPLRLNFQASEERLEQLQAEKVWQKVKDQNAVLAMLRSMPGESFTDRREFEAALKSAAKASGLKLDTPLKKAILSALAERDEAASVCLDGKGHPEAHADLRDTENVPLGEDIKDYVAREVLPYVPDAWVDEAKTKTGYEISFNRYFYKYVPPRPLEDIEADIGALEADIVQMLGQINKRAVSAPE